MHGQQANWERACGARAMQWTGRSRPTAEPPARCVFFPQDEAAAVAIRDQLQTDIAKTGNPVRLGVIYRDAKQFKNVRPGTVEVWLPSLSAPLGEAALPKAAKRY